MSHDSAGQSAMSAKATCPTCGSVLPDGAPQGLCPQCLLEAAQDTMPAPEKTVVVPAGAIGNRQSEIGNLHDFGDYELLEQIAAGGMGVVWKARQRGLNRIVALKMILAGRFAGEGEVKRFRTEAEAAAKLQHPNIVAIHEVGEQHGQHFFSMEFVQGRDLAEVVFAGPLAPERAARYVREVALAIHHAHQRGVLHRDLKPSNILIDAEDRPRVTDFGIARLEGDRGLTQTGAAIGTPSYMSPEQAAGRNSEVGRASDVYSLGAILYELLTARPPFRAATPVETMRQVLETEPASPRWLNSNIPADLDTICLKCLEKDPARRYGSAKELADDLGRFLNHEPVRARPASRLYRVRKWARRKPAHAALVAVCFAALVVLAAGALRYAQTLRDHGLALNERLHHTLVEQARAERLLNHREAALQLLADAAAIQRTPEVRTEAIQAITQPGLRRVFEAPFGSIATYRLSDDGRVLAVGGDTYVTPDWPGFHSNAWQSLVRVWEVASSNLLLEVPWHLDSGPFALSPDGRLLAVSQPAATGGVETAVWDVRTGKSSAQIAAAGLTWFSTDGARLAVQETNRISVWAAGRDSFKPLRASDFAAAILAWTAPDELLLQRFSTNENYRLVRWNLATGREHFPLKDGGFQRDKNGKLVSTADGYGPQTVEVLAVSGNGRVALVRHIVPRTTPGDLFVSDLTTEQTLASMQEPLPAPSFYLLSHDGRRIVFPDVLEAGRLRVFDVTTSKFRLGFGEMGTRLTPSFERFYHANQPTSSGTASYGTLTLRHTNYPIHTAYNGTARRSSPWAAAVRNIDPTSSFLAAESGVGDRELALWELESGRRITGVAQSSAPLLNVSSSGFKERMAELNARMAQESGPVWSGGFRHRLLDLVARLTQGSRPVWSADGRWLAVTTRGWLTMRDGAGGGFSTSSDVAQLWEMLHGATTHRLSSAPRTLAFSPDGGLLAVNMDPYSSVLWNVEKSSAGMRLVATTNRLREDEIFFSTNATWLVNDRSYRRVGTVALVKRFGAPGQPEPLDGTAWVLGRGLSPDGQRLLLVCTAPRWDTNSPVNGPHFQLWDLARRQRVAVWKHPGASSDYGSSTRDGPVVFSPDGRRVATACFSSPGFEIWDPAQGRRLHSFQRPPPTYAPPPRRGFFARMAEFVGARKAPMSRGQAAEHYREQNVRALAFTPDSRLVVSCAEERAVIREVESGRELAQCRATTNILSVAISPDGRTLATGDEDHWLRLWEIPSGRELASWPAHDGAVSALAFTPDGATLASGGRDGSLRLWNLPFIRRELAKLGLDWR